MGGWCHTVSKSCRWHRRYASRASPFPPRDRAQGVSRRDVSPAASFGGLAPGSECCTSHDAWSMRNGLLHQVLKSPYPLAAARADPDTAVADAMSQPDDDDAGATSCAGGGNWLDDGALQMKRGVSGDAGTSPDSTPGMPRFTSYVMWLANALRHGYEHGTVASNAVAPCGAAAAAARVWLGCVYTGHTAGTVPGELDAPFGDSNNGGSRGPPSPAGVLLLPTPVCFASGPWMCGTDAAALESPGAWGRGSHLHRALVAACARLHPLRRALLANMQQQVRWRSLRCTQS